MKFDVIVGTMIGAMLGCIISNYLYQAITDQEWAVALERSYFQVTAVLLALAGLTVTRAVL